MNNAVNGTKINGGLTEASPESTLSDLRALLRQEYPNQSLEIERSGLLAPSKSVFPDTNSKNTLKRLLRHMLRLREMDSIFQNAQRQGRVSFYLTCRGEEAIHFGASSRRHPARNRGQGNTISCKYSKCLTGMFLLQK